VVYPVINYDNYQLLSQEVHIPMFKLSTAPSKPLPRQLHKMTNAQLQGYVNFMQENVDRFSQAPQLKSAAKASDTMLRLGQKELLQRQKKQAAIGHFLETLSAPKATLQQWLKGAAPKQSPWAHNS
jgi:hypothetical protein